MKFAAKLSIRIKYAPVFGNVGNKSCDVGTMC